MNYKKNKNEIIIYDTEEFDVKQILDCGQIFRYTIDGNNAVVYSKDKRAILTTFLDKVVIKTEDADYFEHFFDLERNYSDIKNELKKDEFLRQAVDYGGGIRILNNDAYEMIVSFIISANNNIKRIKNSIEYLCSHFGENKGDYHAFPTLSQLKNATIEDYTKAGLGYRAPYMFETIQKLSKDDLLMLEAMSVQDKFDYLVSLKGIGEKVANCILLFGFSVKNRFPVDTWINKVYNDLSGKTETNRKKITQELTARYGELSGFAQQYFFYYYRENKK